MAIESRAQGRRKEPRAAEAGEPTADPRVDREADDVGAFAAASGHGGRLSMAMAAYPRAPRPWLDLSTGINPEPWNGPRASLEILARLPDPARIAQLEAVAAEAFGVADPARVVATAGAETGLRLLPRTLYADDIDIVSPTYSGHEAAWRNIACRVYRITPERMAGSAADVLLLVNPNNPDGRAVSRDTLAELVAARTRRRSWTVVDESFVETDPVLSVADLESDRLVVLRSFGKFYGLAGLRLGFAIAPPDVAARLRALQGEWPVSAEAVVMGTQAYGDVAWRSKTERGLRQRAADFDEILAGAGLTAVGGTSLFRLVSVAEAPGVFDALCRVGVLTRPFARREDWLRFGLPRREDLTRVGLALRKVAR